MSHLYYIVISCIWRIFDFFTAKKKNMWAFSTHHIHGGRFIENQRAVFENVKNNPDLRKIIFYRGNPDEIDIQGGVNYEIVRHGSARALYLLLFCKVVFITHSVAMDFSLRFGSRDFVILKINLTNRLVVNLWHGIPIKRLLYAANKSTREHTDRVAFRKYERKKYAGLIASSEIDALVMAAMFFPLSYLQIWETGLPRNDFLLMDYDKLPNYIQKSILEIQKIKKNKRLIVYAPTYRQTKVSNKAHYYQFNDNEINRLKDILRKNNAILGYRPHYFKNSDKYFNLDQYIDDEFIFDISQSRIPEFSALARKCDMLVTDYSSVCLETLYLGKTNFSFAYDIVDYKAKQDGIIYNLDVIFSKNVFVKFDNLLDALDIQLQCAEEKTGTKDLSKKIFFKYRDCENSKRVIKKVKESLKI